jgi:hypothetical protein
VKDQLGRTLNFVPAKAGHEKAGPEGRRVKGNPEILYQSPTLARQPYDASSS